MYLSLCISLGSLIAYYANLLVIGKRISLLHNVVKCVRNRTSRFRCFREYRRLWCSKELGEFGLGWVRLG
jgi:hypothetical protein